MSLPTSEATTRPLNRKVFKTIPLTTSWMTSSALSRVMNKGILGLNRFKFGNLMRFRALLNKFWKIDPWKTKPIFCFPWLVLEYWAKFNPRRKFQNLTLLLLAVVIFSIQSWTSEAYINFNFCSINTGVDFNLYSLNGTWCNCRALWNMISCYTDSENSRYTNQHFQVGSKAKFVLKAHSHYLHLVRAAMVICYSAKKSNLLHCNILLQPNSSNGAHGNHPLASKN